VSRLPQVTEQLLSNIPRLEAVRGILAKSAKQYLRSGATREGPEKHIIDCGAHILRVVLDFDALEAQGNSAVLAIDTMRGRTQCYDAVTLEAFANIRCSGVRKMRCANYPSRPFAKEWCSPTTSKMSNGTLLAARGYEVTTSFVERARHFRAGTVKGAGSSHRARRGDVSWCEPSGGSSSTIVREYGPIQRPLSSRRSGIAT